MYVQMRKSIVCSVTIHLVVRTEHSICEWRQITSDSEILEYVEFTDDPSQYNILSERSFNVDEQLAISEEVVKLGVIQGSLNELG